MPRQVDHESRRRRIADAVFFLADESGLEGVTLRDVAARADVSMGAVQRCFRTKEEMLVFALQHVGAGVQARIIARIRESPAQSAPSVLGHALTEITLIGEPYRAEARVWLAFVAQAAVTPALAATLRENYAGLHTLLVRLVTEAVPGIPHEEAAREARSLLAVADGLTAQLLVGHLSPADALTVLDAQLSRLWQRDGPRT